MPANADIFNPHEKLGGPFAVSLALHALLFACAIFLPAILGLGRESWGSNINGNGDAMTAMLVNSVPLPANPEATNVLANESKGLTESLPKPKEEAKAPDAIPIPDRTVKEKKKEERITPTRQKPPKLPPPPISNEVPFGEGGPVSGPYGVFTTPNAKGGFGFTGSGGDFGSRWAWYVDIVRRKVSDNWMKYEVDPSISNAHRVYLYFEINRSGAPTNIRIEQSSGIPSLDQSALRALQRIDTFGPLPSDYPGYSVSVEFWFDYKR